MKRRRRRKMKSPEQPVVEIVKVENENPTAPKWVSVLIEWFPVLVARNC